MDRLLLTREVVSGDSQRVRATAAVGRMDAAVGRREALLARLSLGFTYCTMAETALLNHQIDLAWAFIQQTQRIGRHVQRHVDLPNHVPVITVAELRHKLERLEARVLVLARQLKRTTAP